MKSGGSRDEVIEVEVRKLKNKSLCYNTNISTRVIS